MKTFHEVVDALRSGDLQPEALSAEQLRLKDSAGENLVHWLLVEFELELAKKLINLGLPYDEYSENGSTPLMDCVRLGHRTAVEYLLSLGADPNKHDSVVGETSMTFAAELCRRALEILAVLVRHGGDINIPDTTMDETPLMHLEKALGKEEAARFVERIRLPQK
ncbi:MAG: ankyrin repeat domain-containing protein [Candidatus Sumerlaeia bacterium]|nr:ankyrin repeat domain-containing protein [Candidatus Sumerlaeia bacterium]